MKSKDVFTPGGFPTVTYISDHLEKNRKIVEDALETGGIVISLSGPSKSGKTVFIEEVVGRDSLVHVTGAGVDSTAKLWNRVFDMIGTSVARTASAEKSTTAQLSGKAGGSIGFLMTGKAEAGASFSQETTHDSSETEAIDFLQMFIEEFKGSGLTLFIDDFHYATRDARMRLSEEIKEISRNGISVVCASVPYHSDDVIRGNADLRGRIVIVDFNYWESQLLGKIANQGFEKLGITAPLSLVDRLSLEAAGSPQLMQSLCLNLCYEIGVYETCVSGYEIEEPEELFSRVCRRTALMADYSTVVAMMSSGPKIRGQDRKSHLLKTQEIKDVYPIVIDAISADPPKLTFRYEDLTERIRNLCSESGPVGSSVTGACEQMAIIANNASNGTVIEWDSENDVFDIRDPYLLFYLRWR